MQGTHIKNTFIELAGAPPTPLQRGLDTAPARTHFSLKESLARAAADDDHTSPSNAMRARRKPDPLKYTSQTSMISIPESPSVMMLGHTTLVQTPSYGRKDATKYISGASMGSIPSTPMGLSEWSASTPTGTPCWSSSTGSLHTLHSGYIGSSPPVHQVTYSAPVPVPAPAPAKPPPQRLSLSDMIKSPKAEALPVIYQSAVQHLSTAPPEPQAPPPTYAVPPPQYQPVVPPQAAPAPEEAPPANPTTPAASVLLGLVPAQPQQMQHSMLSSRPAPEGTLGANIAVLSGQVHSVPPSTTTTVLSSPPMYAASQPATTYTAIPPNTVTTLPTATAGNLRLLPPPPTAPAPTTFAGSSLPPAAFNPPVAAPASSPVMRSQQDVDMKVLLDLAIASGNQQAIDALTRQAQQSGMSADRFRQIQETSPK
eukprot:gnl/TRDRNA2_/TRDRNA2_44527_c0_seq1.p1 gnl/TRDRNA2_/TRDRNA2_44527_c0~~gnl/TRDRNA2_/TRDRNA2_44527_c0_seq1.p1  ORF type:complete len:469 (-),score=71.79 gnl/TRDRNA2_/TRDRNA2_44527_c0_seq1:67-1341(-)